MLPINHSISEIREKLRTAKEEQNLTYVDLEKKTGISHSTLQRYLTGDTEKFPLDAIVKISTALSIDPTDVLGWTTETTKPAIVNNDPWDPETMAYSEGGKTERILARGIGRMSPQNREKLLQMARLMFAEDFDEEGHKK